MIFNTRPVKNIGDEVFVGTYGGVDIRFEPSETRYLPSHIAEHVANQLVKAILKKDKDNLAEIGKILGEEIATKESTRILSLKEVIELHEKEFKEMREKKEKEDAILKEKALGIAKKDVRQTTRQPEEGERGDDKEDGSPSQPADR